jgi:hypothetical protein
VRAIDDLLRAVARARSSLEFLLGAQDARDEPIRARRFVLFERVQWNVHHSWKQRRARPSRTSASRARSPARLAVRAMPADDADSGEDETIDETLFVVRDPPRVLGIFRRALVSTPRGVRRRSRPSTRLFR